MARSGGLSRLTRSSSTNGTLDSGGTLPDMSAKEKLIREVLDLEERDAVRAKIVISADWLDEGKPETTELPEAWKTFDDGTPAPNWVALVRDSRRGH